MKITRNSLQTKGELLIFETSYSSLNDMFTKKEAEDIRKEFYSRGIKIRELTNQMYHEPYTDVKEFHEYVMDIRYIGLSKLDIKVDFWNTSRRKI